MIKPKDIAIISCIDTNKKIVGENNNFEYRLFEHEAIKCYTSWRKFGGKYKDINIYSLNTKGPIISKQCLEKLKTLNVTYIENYNQFIATNKIEFIEKLYAQQYFENLKSIPEKYFIYLDLDVSLIKEFPDIVFNIIENDKIVLARHDKVTETFSRDFLYRYNNITQKLKGNCYNAYLVMENKNKKFFTTLYKLIFSRNYKQFYTDFAATTGSNQKLDYYLYEETLYDYIWYINKFDKSIFNINISDLENIYFTHHHLTFKEIFDYKTL